MNDELTEIRADVKKLLDMTKHNQAMLDSIQRRARLTTFIYALKWLIILGISIGAFIYVQPVLDKVLNTYQSISGSTTAGKGGFLDLFKAFK